MKVKDFKYVRAEIGELERATKACVEGIKNARSVQEVLDAKAIYDKASLTFRTYSSLAYMRYTLDTRDEFYTGEQNYYDEVAPVASGLSNEVGLALIESPFRAELEKILPETFFPNIECGLKSHSEETVSLEQEENALVTEYSMLMSTLTTEWEGEQKTISYIRGFMESADRDVRRRAAEAIDRALASVSDKLDSIYDKLVKVRTAIGVALGYKDFIPVGYYRMGRIDYDREMVEKFRQNVLTDIVPVVGKLKKRIADGLGLTKLAFYDNDVIEGEGNPRPIPQGEAIIETAQSMYDEMHPEIGAFMRRMREAEAFDTESREGKWGGGYCIDFPDFKQPFILANFNGSSGDVDVVTHEFGHALAMDYVYDYGSFDADIGSSETAETHSMSMEFLSWKFMDKFFADANRYRYKHLADSLSFIPYGVIVDEFQHIVYANPDMTPEERDSAYMELERKYRPYLDYEGLPYLSKGTRWQYQMHIYETPFYYIDYCLAQVVALEFMAESLKDYEGTLEKYVAHAKRGGKYAFNKLVELAGLVSPFRAGALGSVAEAAEKVISEL